MRFRLRCGIVSAVDVGIGLINDGKGMGVLCVCCCNEDEAAASGTVWMDDRVHNRWFPLISLLLPGVCELQRLCMCVCVCVCVLLLLQNNSG